MPATLKSKLVAVLKGAGKHNSTLAPPVAILWPDKERQWESVLPQLREALPQLLTLGVYEPDALTGPAIWIQCMIKGTVSAGAFSPKSLPIIYLPGVSKEELKSPESAAMLLQPVIPYSYSGSITTQYNGREWTVQSLMENKEDGLGLSVAGGRATKEALLKALPSIFDERIEWPATAIDAGYLHSLLFPNAIPSVLGWLCNGDAFLQSLPKGMAESFAALCEMRFSFKPDHKNVCSIVAKLGSQQGAWREVWQQYAAAPNAYPELEELLRAAKPDDLSTGIFTVPEESWPQVAESDEDSLRTSLSKLAHVEVRNAVESLAKLASDYSYREGWVWFKLGYMPLAKSLPHLLRMCEACSRPAPTQSLGMLKLYYESEGAIADQAMRSAFACARKDADREAITGIIALVYKPWLEQLAMKFQDLLKGAILPLQSEPVIDEDDEMLLFVDAFRFELALAFSERPAQAKYRVKLRGAWSALPSLTPTAKPAVSPVAEDVNPDSQPTEFKPVLTNGRELNHGTFQVALQMRGYNYCSNAASAVAGQKCWLEIGDIDKHGHAEGADLARRMPELFQQIEDKLEVLFRKGIKRVKIVTDHGWLLLPGGLPKTLLSKELTETRWGRCALIKEGATTELLHLPWHWNRNVYIAYAPGISFFKAGEEYAHGGLSLQECVTPIMILEQKVEVQPARIKGEPHWNRMLCSIEIEGGSDGYLVDIRTKLDEPNSSILASGVKAIKDGKASLLVDADYALTSAIVVLMDAEGNIVHFKQTITGA